jgi:hypothetical protein
MQDISKASIIEVFNRIFAIMRTRSFLIFNNESIQGHEFFNNVFETIFELRCGMDFRLTSNRIFDNFYLIFCDIIQSAAVGMSISSIREGAAADFNTTFITIVCGAADWNKFREDSLPKRIVIILRWLYTDELETPDEARGAAAVIPKLRAIHLRLMGEGGLAALDAEIGDLRARYRSVATISRYWRLRFKYNTLHSLVCRMRRKGLFFDVVDDQMRYVLLNTYSLFPS